MKLVLTEFVTLDGVSQGPGSPTEDPSDGFTGGGWLVPYLDEYFVRRTTEWLASPTAPLRASHLRSVRPRLAGDHRPRRSVHRADERATEVRRDKTPSSMASGIRRPYCGARRPSRSAY